MKMSYFYNLCAVTHNTTGFWGRQLSVNRTVAHVKTFQNPGPHPLNAESTCQSASQPKIAPLLYFPGLLFQKDTLSPGREHFSTCYMGCSPFMNHFIKAIRSSKNKSWQRFPPLDAKPLLQRRFAKSSCNFKCIILELIFKEILTRQLTVAVVLLCFPLRLQQHI